MTFKRLAGQSGKLVSYRGRASFDLTTVVHTHIHTLTYTHTYTHYYRCFVKMCQLLTSIPIIGDLLYNSHLSLSLADR